MSLMQTFPPRVRSLIEAVQAADDLTPSTTKRLLTESSVTPDDLAQWADFEHPKVDSYGRNLIWDGGYFEIMAMSWVDGDMAAIHDHGHTQWGAVKLFGPAEHAIFKVEAGEDGDLLTTAERREFAAGSVLAVSHDMIHQMGNIDKEPYLTLHLYGCYGREDGVTADARLYELDEGKIQRTCGGVFFNLPEEAVERREACPQADFPTYLRHQIELLRRLVRAHGSVAAGSFQSARERRIASEIFGAELWRRAAADMERHAVDTPRRQRYLHVLFEELWALARLQWQLSEAGLFEASQVKDQLNVHRRQLRRVLDQQPGRGPATAYLDLVSRTHDLPVAELLAA